MKLKDIINVINGQFNLYVDEVKLLIIDREELIPDVILNMDVKKLEKSDFIDVYLC